MPRCTLPCGAVRCGAVKCDNKPRSPPFLFSEDRNARKQKQQRKKERGVEGWKGKMVSSLSPAGLVHCPAASAETALCPAHHPPAAADTGSSSSRRLKTSQTSPNLHTNRIRVLNKPRAQVRVRSCASQNCRELCVCASLIRGAAERGILEKKAGMRKKSPIPGRRCGFRMTSGGGVPV